MQCICFVRYRNQNVEDHNETSSQQHFETRGLYLQMCVWLVVFPAVSHLIRMYAVKLQATAKHLCFEWTEEVTLLCWVLVVMTTTFLPSVSDQICILMISREHDRVTRVPVCEMFLTGSELCNQWCLCDILEPSFGKLPDECNWTEIYFFLFYHIN